jgi:CheY-like chemotaxis protein
VSVAKRQTKKSLPPAVLVAEGEPTVRALEESIIAELGYETFSAANAREALAVLDDGAPITLLFTDINMPDGPDASTDLNWRSERSNFVQTCASSTRPAAD